MDTLEKSLTSGNLTIREVTQKKPRTPVSAKDQFDRRQKRQLIRLRALHDTLAERVSGLINEVNSLKEISEAAGALDRLSRITDRLVEMEKQILGLDTAADLVGDDFARLLKNAWERAYGTPPLETDYS